MPNNRFTHLRDIHQSCPFNAMIECTKHGGNVSPNLPDCCTHCGWNPAEFKRRKIKLSDEAAEFKRRKIKLSDEAAEYCRVDVEIMTQLEALLYGK